VAAALIDVGQGPLEVELIPAGTAGPDRAPLVFLHEGLGSVGLWRDFPATVRAALDEPATLIYSRAGYGRSAPVTEPRPLRFMHDEALTVLPALLDRCDVERPVLIGHSDGASIAIIHAGAGHPVSGLVLIAPHVFVEAVTIAGIEAADAAFRAGPLRDRLARHHADVDATFHGWAGAWLAPEFRTWNIEDSLGGIECPVLAIQGDADGFGTLAQIDAIAAGVKGPFTPLVLPGAGHAPHFDAPEAVVQAIRDTVRV
jgi:pimeloyl-ACP methyl ester carboxylesterase